MTPMEINLAIFLIAILAGVATRSRIMTSSRATAILMVVLVAVPLVFYFWHADLIRYEGVGFTDALGNAIIAAFLGLGVPYIALAVRSIFRHPSVTQL